MPSLAFVKGGDNNPVLGGPDRYYDISQFAPSKLGFFGTAGRNTVTGPGIATFDLSFLKDFEVTGNTRIQFRAEFFNLFNRPNFGGTESGKFMDPFDFGAGAEDVAAARAAGKDLVKEGLVDADAARIFDTRTSARQIQFGLKFIF